MANTMSSAKWKWPTVRGLTASSWRPSRSIPMSSPPLPLSPWKPTPGSGVAGRWGDPEGEPAQLLLPKLQEGDAEHAGLLRKPALKPRGENAELAGSRRLLWSLRLLLLPQPPLRFLRQPQVLEYPVLGLCPGGSSAPRLLLATSRKLLPGLVSPAIGGEHILEMGFDAARSPHPQIIFGFLLGYTFRQNVTNIDK